MNDQEASIHIVLAVGCLETVRYYQTKVNPKSARARALSDLIDRSLKVCDMYRVHAWSQENQNKASNVLDRIEQMVKQKFDPKLVERDSKGRFKKLAGVE